MHIKHHTNTSFNFQSLKLQVMNTLIKEFKEDNKKLIIDSHPTQTQFIIIRNCTFKQGAELCKKYKAFGRSCGKHYQDFKIGNFGQYN